MTDGGPAFPRPIGEYKEVGAGSYNQAQTGMSLRDWFAGMALQALSDTDSSLEEAKAAGNHADYAETIAAMCYELADAMLQQREERG